MQQLFADLDCCPRASSGTGNINGILKGFLVDRRSLASYCQTAQLYINLFTLWYNSHLFKRGLDAVKVLSSGLTLIQQSVSG